MAVLSVCLASAGCSMCDACKPACQQEQQCKPAPEPACKPAPVCTPECTTPEADIEVLNAVNVPCTTPLAIGYQIDTKKTCDDFDLLVRVEHCGEVLFERLVHLGRPYRTDGDGDRHFHGSIYGELPHIVCANRETLRITGWVIPHASNGDVGAMIDRETNRVHGSEGTIFGQYVPRGWPKAPVH